MKSTPTTSQRPTRVKALVFGYLCQPGRGSERGAAWGMVRALHQFSDCTLVTGPESGGAMGWWAAQHPESRLEVISVREPLLAPLFKRFHIGEFLVYLAWQRRARRVVRDRAIETDFDVAVHVSLSAFWLPALAVDLGIPSIWGPVGGAVTTPLRLLPLLGWKGVLSEGIDWLAVRIMSLLPATRRTWRAASVRVVQNQETLHRLPRAFQSDAVVMNHALFHSISHEITGDLLPVGSPYVAWVSPLDSRKGPELAIRAFAAMSEEVQLVVVGDGAERARIEGLAEKLGVADRTTFTGWVAHSLALEILGGASVALFTGMREEGGLALAEALLLGTRVVVLGNGGAESIARSATDQGRVTVVEAGALRDTIRAMGAAIEEQARRSEHDVPGSQSTLIDTAAYGDMLRSLVAGAIDRGVVGPT